MYLISQGSCDVTIFDRAEGSENMEDLHIRKLNTYDYFGEISLVHDSVRTATVTCSNYCTLGKISLVTLYELCASYSFFRTALMNTVKLYDDSSKVFLHTVLRDIPYLSDCSEDTISALAMSMKQDFLEPGSAYFHEGETQECLTIIQDGVIEI